MGDGVVELGHGRADAFILGIAQQGQLLLGQLRRIAAYRLGLEEGPQVGRLLMLQDDFGLVGLGQGFGNGQHQRQDGDEQGQLLVAGGMGVLGVFQVFGGFRHDRCWYGSKGGRPGNWAAFQQRFTCTSVDLNHHETRLFPVGGASYPQG
jgi:hypothetical protein